jgi:hypothetical protein
VSCTAELRTAVQVTVTAEGGLTIDRVTAERGKEHDCEPWDDVAVNPALYSCHEQGGGKYTVRVYSGMLTWTRSVEVPEDDDGCHVTETKELEITASAATAD